MVQFEDFIVLGGKWKVSKLRKSIYGLNQSLGQWYICFYETIISFQFKVIEIDMCIHIKHEIKNKFVILTYIDNILLAENDISLITSVKT